jgi:uncharacterized protein (TIGR03067 family)
MTRTVFTSARQRYDPAALKARMGLVLGGLPQRQHRIRFPHFWSLPMKSLFVALVLIAVVFPIAARCDEKAKDEKELYATWEVSTAELAGKKLPEESLKTWRLTLTEKKYIFKTVGEADEGTYTLIENKEKSDDKKFKAMDIKGGDAGPNKGKTFHCIYELKDDTLTVCYDLEGKMRPTEFKTKPDSKLFLVTYKREKK